jgi:S1-C subfamily serine protease
MPGSSADQDGTVTTAPGHAPAVTSNSLETEPPGAGRRPRGLTRVAALAAAGALVIGAGFGVFAAAGGLSRTPPPPSAVIPAPARSNATFVEDDDGMAQDNQTNILQSAAPGLVQILLPGGLPAGAGLVITPSGKVLTAAQNLPAAGPVTVRFVMAGADFPARVIGTDPAADLALIQLLDGHGRPFPVAAIGNSASFFSSQARAQIAAWHLGGTITVTAVGSSGDGATLDIGDLTGLSTTVTTGGVSLSGLFRTTAQVRPGQETGGPLVGLTGEVIGIDVAGTGTGLTSAGYAIPINQALSIARSIDRKASHS